MIYIKIEDKIHKVDGGAMFPSIKHKVALERAVIAQLESEELQWVKSYSEDAALKKFTKKYEGRE